MGSETVLSIINLLNTLAKLAAAHNVSLIQLVQLKQQAEAEGKQLDVAVLKVLVNKNRAQLNALEQKLWEVDN